MNNQLTFRSFVAFDFNDSVKQRFFKIQQDFKSLKPARINYTKEVQFHVTTFFLGDITITQSKEIEKILEKIQVNQEVVFRFSRIEYFPSERKPKVIVLKGHTQETTKILVDNMDSQLLILGFKRDKKWLPHLTIGRSKELFEIPKFSFTEFYAKPVSLTLYKSTLEKNGSIYEKLYSRYL